MELMALAADSVLGGMTLLTQSANNDAPQDWSGAVMAIAGITMVTVIASIAIWQVFASWRARMSIAREDAYRKLAEEAGATQKRLLELQERLSGDVADLRTRVSGIEQTLRQID